MVLRNGTKLLTGWLAHPRLALHLAFLAVVLSLPALWVGWQLDDHLHRVMMVGEAELPAFQAFSMLNGDPEIVRVYRDLGTLPWWTFEELRLSFFRFLSVLSMWIDYRLWPESAALMHLHSLLWFGALVAVACGFYRQVMGPTTVAGLAALLYAVDEAHAGPASWLANRNALLATCFGLLCLYAHDRWRRSGKRWGAVAGPAFLAMGLASGEFALGAAAYLAAHALALESGPLSRRLAGLLPSAAVLGIWAIAYRIFGFGAYGSAMYVDPARSPAAFAGVFVERAPFLLLGQWSPVSADMGSFLPDAPTRVFWMVAVGVVLVLAVLLWPLLRRDRVARFWCLGMAISLVPISATFPSNRLLFFVGLGAMGLLAQFLVGVFTREPWLPPGRLWRVAGRIAAVLLILSHLVIAPLSMPVGAYITKWLGDPMIRAMESLPADEAISQQDLVIVNAPDYLFFVSHIPTVQVLEDRPFPRRIRGLAIAPAPVLLTRVDERTLRVRIDAGLFSGPLGGLFRGPQQPMAAGDSVRLTGMEATVKEVTLDAGPSDVQYEFSRPLEDKSLRWVRWQDGVYVPFTPPAVGESVELEPALGPLDVLASGR